MAKVVDIQNDERRRDRRRSVLVSGRLDDRPVKILDVSLGGVGCAVELAGGDLEDGQDYIPPGDGYLTLEVEGRSGATHLFLVQVTWVNEEAGTFGAAFGALSDDQFRVLEKLIIGRLV